MRRKSIQATIIAALLIVAAFLYKMIPFNAYRAEEISAVHRTHGDYNDITLEHPLDGTLFPPEMAPPVFRWNDSAVAGGAWLVRMEWPGVSSPLDYVTRRPHWTPPPGDWERIKRAALEQVAEVVILGVGPGRPIKVRSRTRASFRTSRDPVGAPLFYREVELPFVEANRHLPRICWRFGPIASKPPVVLKGLPVCGNCHSFSTDGAALAMDVDYANKKGSYVIADIREETVLTKENVISWADYQKTGSTHGLLSQISPDGRYVVSTVRDITVFVPQPDLAFSQVFFPVKGILCIYDRQTGRFEALPGADDPAFVQTNPTWSPDGRDIVFARTAAPDLSHTKHQGDVWLTPTECREFIADDRPFRFDLYRIPFNDGAGGRAEPVEGASHNGMSNFFARYSPDGRWIVYCQARRYMLLQPDSTLYIIPSTGGAARRLQCNTARMNSWHSFSPNGKWLVFASKAYSDYTQLCLTHIDANGDSTPAVLLAHLTASNRAANIPEFVNARPQAIQRIDARRLQRR